MAVEMNYTDGSISSVYTPQKWKSNRVVSTEGNNSRQRLAGLRRAFFLRIGGWCAIQNAIVTLFDLVDRIGIVIAQNHRQLRGQAQCHEDLRGHRNITTIENSCPTVEWVLVKRHIISPTEAHLS